VLKLTSLARGTKLSTWERKQVLLVRCGLTPVLAQILESWEAAAGEATLRLDIETVHNLSLQEVPSSSASVLTDFSYVDKLGSR